MPPQIRTLAQMTPDERLALTQDEIDACFSALAATGFQFGTRVTSEDLWRLEPYAQGTYNPERPFSYEIGVLMALAIGA